MTSDLVDPFLRVVTSSERLFDITYMDPFLLVFAVAATTLHVTDHILSNPSVHCNLNTLLNRPTSLRRPFCYYEYIVTSSKQP